MAVERLMKATDPNLAFMLLDTPLLHCRGAGPLEI
ncbi:hypothetical protein J2851_006084 [Azospirillum rugosum]|uniref:Uncharacterized protein n=1 Tax=Azospirillum rugosum TaxID=416170 RepID=A0ABS4SUM2_9PROT|nr:hypothetical protein [Azospirillum rugosum]MDQ0529789.1 hypothetical protein [Azospirillum rugosum]